MRFALLLLLTSCVISDDDDVDPRCGDGFVDRGETCDDGNSVGGDGCTACAIDVAPRRIDVTWGFTSLASGAELGCAGAEMARVTTRQVDAAGIATGPERSDPFPCSVRAAGIPVEVDELGGLFETRVRFTDGAAAQYAESLAEIVDVTAMDREIAFEVFADAGFVRVEWALAGLSCADDEVAIEVTSTSVTKTYVDDFSCEDGQGLTGGMLAGTYDVTVRAMQQDAELAVATALGAVVGDRNRVTSLGVIDLVAP